MPDSSTVIEDVRLDAQAHAPAVSPSTRIRQFEMGTKHGSCLCQTGDPYRSDPVSVVSAGAVAVRKRRTNFEPNKEADATADPTTCTLSF